MKIRCQNSRAGAKFLISCVLCLAFCSYCMLASAQEMEVEVIVEDKDSSEKAVDVIVTSEDPSDAGDSEQMETDADGSERRDVDANRQERNARRRQAQRSQQGERARQRPDEMFPPEVRKIMEEENISPQDLQDPEIRRKLREKVESLRKESEGDSSAEEAPEQEPQGRPGRPERSGRPRQGGSSADDGLSRYMDAVVKKNLFLPLGSGGEERRSSYSLTAVISDTSSESNNKAIIEERGGGKSYYVSEGDTFANEIKVEEIAEEVVKLDRSGEEEEIRLGEGTGGGGRRGGGGGRRPGGAPGGERGPGEADRPEGGPNRGGQDDFDPSQIPPFARRILEERGISIDELRSNPELRESLQREFEQRFRGGGEGRQRRRSERVSPNRVRRR